MSRELPPRGGGFSARSAISLLEAGGAAPGGWSWQLVQRGMQVVAIDNGPMDQALMESGQVTHLREDAFAYKPQRPVDWLVCDMVEKPARVAQLMERWLARG